MSPQLADKLVMALDFGETNSSVSYTFIPEGFQPQDLPDFQPRTVLNNFSRMMNCRENSTHLQVPTLLRYPEDWAFDPLDELIEQPLGFIRPDHQRIHWGLQVQQDMSRVMSHSKPNQMLLHGFKSLMTESAHHQVQNKRLIKSLSQLSQKLTCEGEVQSPMLTGKKRPNSEQKVVLAGGFGESIPLQRHLRETLEIFNAANNCDVELHLVGEHHQITTIDAVSFGGVLRALDKSNGPTRVATSSYGIRCDEPFEGPKHDGQPVIWGFQKKDERYVQAIEWISKKGRDIPPLFEKSAKRIQTFPYWKADRTVNHGPFICQEEIWVSDKARLDHCSYRDKHNEDAEMIGILETDVTHLRQYFIRGPDESQDPHHNDSRRWYWEFPYELVLTIDGLNMKCVQVFNGQQIGAMSVGIAPGFTPGVN